MFVPGPRPRYSEAEAREAIRQSSSYAEALRKLGMRSAGHNSRTLRKYAEEIWHLPVDHFQADKVRNEALARARAGRVIPLSEVLVRGSTYHRGRLKERLYAAGLKRAVCELCGQGEIWRGKRISLVLDHINGMADDNRIENLQIVCPNCAAGLDTHCGRQNRLERAPRRCLHCDHQFRPRYFQQRYCSRYCGQRAKGDGSPQPHLRKVERPPYTHLLREVQAMGYLATARRYGVSDNAIRKWIRQYEKERAAAEARDDDVAA